MLVNGWKIIADELIGMPKFERMIQMKILSDALRYVESFLFFATFIVGLISSKTVGMIWLSFLIILLVHWLIDKDYANEWVRYIFGK